jgi:hypothetical protein
VASDQKGITFPLSGQRIATFMLDISKLPKGYDINKIRTIAGLSPNRAYQKYKLFLSKVSTLDKFISMGIYEMDSLLRKV